MQETSEKLTQVLEEFGLNQNQIDRAIESINPVCKPDDVSFMVQEIEKRRERLKIPKLQMCREMDISDNTYRSYERSGFLNANLRQILKILRYLDEVENNIG